MLINGSTIENAIRNLNVEEKYKIDHYRRIWDFSILSAKRDKIRSTGYVVDTLEAAIWSFYNSKDYKDAIFTAINLGNDTDTVAAVCGGMAGIIYEIPKNMKSKVKNHKIIKKTIKKFKNRQ
jgi:ADP-ribosylglycohydrolase